MGSTPSGSAMVISCVAPARPPARPAGGGQQRVDGVPGVVQPDDRHAGLPADAYELVRVPLRVQRLAELVDRDVLAALVRLAGREPLLELDPAQRSQAREGLSAVRRPRAGRDGP